MTVRVQSLTATHNEDFKWMKFPVRTGVAHAHFKKDGAAMRQETAEALAELILAAQRAVELQERS